VQVQATVQLLVRWPPYRFGNPNRSQ